MSDIEHEIETKIVVSGKDLEKLFDALSPDAVNGKIKEKHRPRAYFDTPKRDVSKARMAMRVQYKESAGSYEQTLKFEDSVGQGDKMSRIEVKNMLSGKKEHPDMSLIDLSVIKDKKVSEQLKEMKSKKLEHVFTASVRRRYFVLPVMQGGEEIGMVELAFDVGRVAHAEEQDLFEEVSEVEVELKSGDPAAVDIMCDRILKMAPNAAISSVSKAEAGYNLDDRAQERKKKIKENTKAFDKDCKDLKEENGKKVVKKNS